MKFLLKTFLITFAFSQIAMAGRMFDPEVGRFISRDPLGYVDGMSLYNGYFAESFGVDPMGTEKKLPITIKECIESCPDKVVGFQDTGRNQVPIVKPDPKCVARCKKICAYDPDEDDCDLSKAQLVIDMKKTKIDLKTGEFDAEVSIVNVNPKCCSKVGIVQLYKYTSQGILPDTKKWTIDTGGFRGGAKIDTAPFYDKPTGPLRNKTSYQLVFNDGPDSSEGGFFEFKTYFVCTEGKSTGRILGSFTWSAHSKGIVQSGNQWRQFSLNGEEKEHYIPPDPNAKK